ncbi:tRNA pseudouridine(13) synthase TruD [Patescibacteria group bacterium]|nr:tRNA pseudouridine(13) synthase TruD [Patescibacteria group bacterium]
MNNSLNYKLKCINEDFQVTEVSLMPSFVLSGPRKFTYIWLQKSGFTTFEVLEQIKVFFKLSFEDVSCQGLKDEEAITEQLISVKKILSEKDIKAFNKKHTFKNKFAKIKYIVGYGEKPIKERALHGNAFKIVVRNLNSTFADNLLNYIHDHKQLYFINYYDNQRFGMPGGPHNTHLIGKSIMKNNWKQAYDQLKITNNITQEVGLKTNEVSDFKKVFASMNPKKVSFFVSAYNSFLWNAEASLVIKKHTKSKICLFENVGKLYLPTDYLFQCPHICEAGGYELIAENLSVQSKPNKRNLLVATNMYAHDLEPDELYKNKKKITLSFYLPTGSYATMIVKQLFLKLKYRN